MLDLKIKFFFVQQTLKMTEETFDYTSRFCSVQIDEHVFNLARNANEITYEAKTLTQLSISPYWLSQFTLKKYFFIKSKETLHLDKNHKNKHCIPRNVNTFLHHRYLKYPILTAEIP